MNIKLKRTAMMAIISTVLFGYGTNAMADPTADLIRTLVEKGILTEEEALPLLQSLANNEKSAVEEEKVVAEEAKSRATVDIGKKGLVVTSADDEYSMAIGGRLHVEAMGHSNDQDLTRGATDGTDIRRARMYIKGKAAKDWKYMIEADLAGNKVSMKDVLGVYTGVKDWDFTFGAQKHAMSMEVQESTNDIMFTERGLTYALTTPYFDRALGINAKMKGDNWNVQAGYYGDQFAPESSGDVDEGYGYAIRGTWNPIWDKSAGNMVHLGANYGLRAVSNQTNKISGGGKGDFSYETTNGSNLKLLDTPDIIGLDEVKVGVLELAAMHGPLSFQAEYAKADVEATQDYDFTAWYANVGYTLTGEYRSYNPQDGEFKRLKPKSNFSLNNGTWGAWELAARLDQLDLNDSNVLGGDGKRYTFALNWYLNYNFRIMADYSRIYDITDGPVTKLDGGDADDIDTFTLRAQWAF
ncbi:MAG: OprO/OprP family phosphate-selective porin [Gammaproteobacteria bacterium]